MSLRILIAVHVPRTEAYDFHDLSTRNEIRIYANRFYTIDGLNFNHSKIIFELVFFVKVLRVFCNFKDGCGLPPFHEPIRTKSEDATRFERTMGCRQDYIGCN